MPAMHRAASVTHAFFRIISPCSRSYAMIGSAMFSSSSLASDAIEIVTS